MAACLPEADDGHYSSHPTKIQHLHAATMVALRKLT
jgi:hypothetical protein